MTDFTFAIASFSGWGTDAISSQLIEFFRTSDFFPDVLDQHDPARRRFTGSHLDIDFWLAKEPEDWGRILHIQRRRPPRHWLCAHWINYENELMRYRGDYDFLYGQAERTDLGSALQLWKGLCHCLRPFHAYLDRSDRRDIRIQFRRHDGTIEKPMGGYLQHLPGFFAYNYFGPVYVRTFGPKLASLPRVEWTADGGVILPSPVAIDAPCSYDEPYSESERGLIRALGEDYFFLTHEPFALKSAPTLTEFRANVTPIDRR